MVALLTPTTTSTKNQMIYQVFDDFLSNTIAEDDNFLIGIVECPDFLQIETIALAAFIPELFNKLQALGQRNWYLENDLSAVKMIGDRQRITQAIINLANNAVQHTTTNSLIVLGAKLDGDRKISRYQLLLSLL